MRGPHSKKPRMKKIFLFLLVLLLPIFCLAGSQLDGKYENIETPGSMGRMALTFHPDKTATLKHLKTGVYEFTTARYKVTDKTIQVQGFPWLLNILDDRSLDGLIALGIFNKI